MHQTIIHTCTYIIVCNYLPPKVHCITCIYFVCLGFSWFQFWAVLGGLKQVNQLHVYCRICCQVSNPNYNSWLIGFVVVLFMQYLCSNVVGLWL